MTVSPSFHTVSTPTSSIRDRNLPIISFVGRPGDPRKGLITLLDAIGLLLRVAQVPRFTVWIVGGSDDEADLIERLLRARHDVANDVVIWGRVTTEALPELYSRSSVVVVPSSREQFGIVAVEAMMCGTPVIASRVGGLADAVLDGYAGTLTSVDDASSLANAILGYLRNPDRVTRGGADAVRWARLAFCREDAYRSVIDVYDGRRLPEAFPTREELRRSQLALLETYVRDALGQTAVIEPIPEARGVAALASAGTRRSFCRLFGHDTLPAASILPLPEPLRHEESADDYASVLAFHAANALVPRAEVRPAPYRPIAVFPWLEAAPASPGAFRDLAAKFRAFAPLDERDAASKSHLDALRQIEDQPTLRSIALHDMASAELNARIFGRLRFGMTHPQVELLRLQLLLRDGAWLVPAEAVARFDGAIELVRSAMPVAKELPAVCHGALAPDRLLLGGNGSVIARDPRHSRYVVGPYDEAQCVWTDVARGSGPAAAVSRLRGLIANDDALPLGVCWLLVLVLVDALRTITIGRDIGSTPAMRFCRDLQHLWGRGLIR